VGADVETVVLCALDRDPARRYARAADLSRDLGHLLARRPIEARRPGPMLRSRRWFQRHPAAGTALVLGPALVLGAATAIIAREKAHSLALGAKLEETRVARDLAKEEGERAARAGRTAELALEFVTNLFAPADGRHAKAWAETTARDLLVRGSA